MKSAGNLPGRPWFDRVEAPSFGIGVESLTRAAAVVAVAALWVFCHPYCGLVGDSNVYLGRVVADLAPDGVGRDLMFMNDGQSRFSLFHVVANPIVAALGLAGAGKAIAALGTACWCAALFALTRRLSSGRTAWAMLVVVSVLPVDYGDLGIFTFGETGALPRPFAEAAVMAALAATLGERRLLAIGLLALAVLFHPLMGLGGVCVVLGLAWWQTPWFRSRAGLGISAAGAAAGLGMAWLGVPILDRLLQTIDPVWFGMIVQRSPFLFPTLWDATAFTPIVAQAATLAIAAHLAPAPQRRLFVAVLITAALGIGATALFADMLHLMLVVQIQMWRATWLLAVIGGCALAFCTAALWPRGPASRVTLALLALTWFFQPHPVISLAIAGLALVLHFGTIGARLPLGSRSVALVYAIVGMLVLDWNLGPLLGYFDHILHLAPGQSLGLVDPLRNNLHTIPICLVLAIWLVNPHAMLPKRQAALVLCSGAALLVVATAWLWDQRLAGASYFAAPHEPAGFAALAAGRPQEVLWLDGGPEAWYTLGRPQYLSGQQAVSIVFSRPLAMEWRRRATRLVDLGLAKRAIFEPWARIDDDDRLHVTQAALDSLCRQPDAPGSVVVPIERDQPVPNLSGLIVWPLPTPRFMVQRYSRDETHVVVAYGLVPCAARRGE